MSQFIILRHAERNPIANLHDALHAKLTDKGRKDSREFGERMAKAFKNERIFVASNQLDRCKETAREFVNGYGDGAIYKGAEKKGALSYLFPGMSEKINELGFEEDQLFQAYGKDIMDCPKNFERDYTGTIIKWLNGGFDKIMISPFDIYNEMLGVIKTAEEKRTIIFTSDIQISIVAALEGLEELIEKRPDYLHGIFTSSFWKMKWKMFSPERIDEMKKGTENNPARLQTPIIG